MEIKYHIPEATPVVDKKTGKKGYKIKQYTWYENGKRRRNDTKFHLTKEECKKEALARISDNADIIDSKDRLTIEGLILLYKKEIENSNLSSMSASSKKSYIERCDALIRFTPKKILNTMINKFSIDDLSVWLNHLKNGVKTPQKKKLSANYYAHIRTVIRKVFKYAYENNYFSYSLDRYSNICSFIDQDDTPQRIKKKFRYLRLEQFNIFASCCLTGKEHNPKNSDSFIKIMNLDFKFKNYSYHNIKMYVFFNILFWTGCRTEEARVITWSDINFKEADGEGRIHINKAFTFKHRLQDRDEYLNNMKLKNDDSKRSIPIHPQLKKVLLKYKKYLHDSNQYNEIVCPGSKGKYISDNAIASKINYCLDLAKIKNKISKHDFRRSCCMYLCYVLQVPKDKARYMFGHHDETMIEEVYGYFDEVWKANQLSKSLSEHGFFTSSAIDGTTLYYFDGRIEKQAKGELEAYYNQNGTD